MSDPETLYSTEEAAAYLGVSLRTLANYQKAGKLTPLYEGDARVWRKEDLDAAKAAWPNGKKPTGLPARETADLFQQALAKVTNGQTPEQLMQAMGITDTSSMRDIATALQRYIARMVIEFQAVGSLVADLGNPDWKARHSAAEKLLAKVLPTVKAVEITRPPDPDTAHRQERALKVLEEIAAQGRLRQVNHNVRILEAEDAEVVEE